MSNKLAEAQKRVNFENNNVTLQFVRLMKSNTSNQIIQVVSAIHATVSVLQKHCRRQSKMRIDQSNLKQINQFYFLYSDKLFIPETTKRNFL